MSGATTGALESSRTSAADSSGLNVMFVVQKHLPILAAVAIPRIGSLWGSLAAWLGWAGADLALYWAVFVGAR
jgi:hypothetical protein